MSSSAFLAEILILLVAICFILYKLLTRNFDYWEKRNVPYVKPVPFFGSLFEVMTLRTTIGLYLAKLYTQFNEPYFGIFILNQPTLVIKSSELMKAILVKDFNYFCDRVALSDKKCDSLISNVLFVLKNPEWRIIRNKLSPVFTSGRIKLMIPLLNDVSEEMVKYINVNSSKESIEAKELCAKYATDIIASCAFGIKSGCFENENAKFRVVGRKILNFNLESIIRQVCCILIPSLGTRFKMRYFPVGINEFFRDVFWATIGTREETNICRNDLIDILIQMKNQHDPNIDFSGDVVVAQATLFFLAGLETTSSTIAFTLYELCISPKIQNKARSEIKRVLKKHGSFTYEAILDMKYIQMVIYETLRKYPPLPFLHRVCVEDYKVPNSDLVIEKGTAVYIPMTGVHHDPEFYPEPEKYDPERFSEEHSLPSFSFLAFGGGPRYCMGERLGLLSSKLSVAHILLEYELERSSDTLVPFEFETKSLSMAAKGGLPIKFKKIISDSV